MTRFLKILGLSTIGMVWFWTSWFSAFYLLDNHLFLALAVFLHIFIVGFTLAAYFGGAFEQ